MYRASRGWRGTEKQKEHGTAQEDQEQGDREDRAQSEVPIGPHSEIALYGRGRSTVITLFAQQQGHSQGTMDKENEHLERRLNSCIFPIV
jgi:hypothetical protein